MPWVLQVRFVALVGMETHRSTHACLNFWRQLSARKNRRLELTMRNTVCTQSLRA